MQLKRLLVENFGCVGQAAVEFGPRLNILYGPNELGKSSLVDAVRAALLMQHTSAEAKRWVPWNTERLPEVELTFQTEPLRVYRVRKKFGKSGRSKLDDSKDGVNFGSAIEGRLVDGELRKLLRWGVAEGARGLPESFLTHVLLPQQDGVSSIFEAKLDDDGDPSAKNWLIDALQAAAADPRVKHVLDAAQAKVEEVFRADGQFNRKRTSPFVQIQEQIKQLEEAATEARKRWQETQTVQAEIREKQKELLECETEFEAQRVRCGRYGQALALCGEIQRLHESCAKLEGLEAAQRTLSERAAAFAARRAELQRTLATLEQALDQARQALLQLQSDSAESERRLREQTLRNQRLELDAQAKACDLAIQRAAQARKVEAKRAEAAQGLAGVQRDLKKLAADSQALTDSLTRLEGLSAWFAWQDSQARLAAATAEANESAAWLARQQALEMKRTELTEQLAKRKLPERPTVDALRKLDLERRLAQAQLEVGLVLEATALAPVKLNITPDSDAAERKTLKTKAAWEAKSQIKIVVADTVELVVRGGRADARERLDALDARWASEAAPVLKAAKTKDVEALSNAVTQADQDRQALRAVEQELAHLAAQIARAGDRQGMLVALQADVARSDQALAVHDRARLARDAEAFRSAAAPQRAARLAAEEKAAQKNLEDAKLEIARLETRREAFERQAAEVQAEISALAAADWQAEEKAAVAQKAQLEKTRGELDRAQAALDRETSAAVSGAQQGVAQAEARVSQAKGDLQRLDAEERQTADELSRCQGELKALRDSESSRLDLDGARLRRTALEADLAKLTGVPPQLSERDLEAETRRLKELERHVQQVRSTIDRQQGALEQVGGEAARERLAALGEAVARMRDDEVEMTRDYRAWQLLLESIKTAERTQSTHLGQALMAPLSARIASLTGGRHQRLDVGPGLDLGGIVSLGEAREAEHFSLGAREQLATLFRLALAEQLGCFLILDDQLVQSDNDRLQWFHSQLRAAKQPIQIIVITCRPLDYLTPAELAGSADESVRAVNLAELVRPLE